MEYTEEFEKQFESDFKLAVVIDAQVDFMDPNGALYVGGAEHVTPILNEYLKELTIENGYIGVVFTADTHHMETYENSEEGKLFPAHCIAGTDGFSFAIDVKNVPTQTRKMILNKGVFNMWEEPSLVVRPYKLDGEPMSFGGETDRDEYFQNIINQGIDVVEIVGVASDYCVKWAIQGFLARGFKVITYDNLTAGIDRGIDEVVSEEFDGLNVLVR